LCFSVPFDIWYQNIRTSSFYLFLKFNIAKYILKSCQTFIILVIRYLHFSMNEKSVKFLYSGCKEFLQFDGEKVFGRNNKKNKNRIGLIL